MNNQIRSDYFSFVQFSFILFYLPASFPAMSLASTMSEDKPCRPYLALHYRRRYDIRTVGKEAQQMGLCREII